MRLASFVVLSVLCAASAANAQTNPRLTGARRANSVVQVFANGRVLARYWTELLALGPREPVRVRITLWVNARGRFTRVDVENTPDRRFNVCLRRGVRALPPVDPGERGEPTAATINVRLTPPDLSAQWVRSPRVPLMRALLRGVGAAEPTEVVALRGSPNRPIGPTNHPFARAVVRATARNSPAS